MAARYHPGRHLFRGFGMRLWVGVVAAWGVAAVILAAVMVWEIWERIRGPRPLKPGDLVKGWAVPVRRRCGETIGFVSTRGIVSRCWRDPKTMELWVEVETPGHPRFMQTEAEHWRLER